MGIVNRNTYLHVTLSAKRNIFHTGTKFYDAVLLLASVFGIADLNALGIDALYRLTPIGFLAVVLKI